VGLFMVRALGEAIQYEVHEITNIQGPVSRVRAATWRPGAVPLHASDGAVMITSVLRIFKK
jgi:hypothetical protein